MRQTERRGRALLIATALTGTLMLVLAGVLSTGGLPGASLSPASMSGFQRPAAPPSCVPPSPAKADVEPDRQDVEPDRKKDKKRGKCRR